MPGEFGDIEWKRLDPKTWELSNKPPPMPPPGLPETPAMSNAFRNAVMQTDAFGMMSSATVTDSERKNWELGEQLRNRKREMAEEGTFADTKPKGAYGRLWRRDMRRIGKTGLDGLFHRGDVWIDESGDVYSYFPLREREMRTIMDRLRSATPEEMQNFWDRSRYPRGGVGPDRFTMKPQPEPGDLQMGNEGQNEPMR